MLDLAVLGGRTALRREYPSLSSSRLRCSDSMRCRRTASLRLRNVRSCEVGGWLDLRIDSIAGVVFLLLLDVRVLLIAALAAPALVNGAGAGASGRDRNWIESMRPGHGRDIRNGRRGGPFCPAPSAGSDMGLVRRDVAAERIRERRRGDAGGVSNRGIRPGREGRTIGVGREKTGGQIKIHGTLCHAINVAHKDSGWMAKTYERCLWRNWAAMADWHRTECSDSPSSAPSRKSWCGQAIQTCTTLSAGGQQQSRIP